jgi:hypothetical protein
MTKAEARACVKRIRDGIDDVRRQVLDLHEREGWRSLGYDSWRQCVTAEFPTTARRLYQELSAARVERNLNHGSQAQPPIPERQLRELGKLEPEDQPEAWAEAVETAPDGVMTARHVAAVVAKRLEPEPEEEPEAPEEFKVTLIDSVIDDSVQEVMEELGRAVVEEPEPPEKEPEPTQPEPEIDRHALAAQRNADPEFAEWLKAERVYAESMGSRPMKMAVFVLDGGEDAMVLLGVDWAVDVDALKRAYRAASFACHPDRGGSREDFIAVTEAYRMVSAFVEPAPAP